VSKGDADRTDDHERYRQSHDHTFGDGPPPKAVGSDSIEVTLSDVPYGFMYVRQPTVAMKYASGRQIFEGDGLSCGLMVAPVEKEDGMIVYMGGSQSEVLHMTMAVINAAEQFGLADTIKLCVERGVSLEQVAKILAEEHYP